MEEPAALGAVPGTRCAIASFDDVYRSEFAGLVRVAYALTGRRDVAEELVQDAFEAAHRRWRRIGGYDQPGAWVRRVVLHRCIGRHRRLATETRLLVRLGQRRDTVVDATPTLDHELLGAIRALPGRQAQVITLVFLDDRTVDETATLLGCGPETVRTHLRRGRLTLAARLGIDGETTA